MLARDHGDWFKNGAREKISTIRRHSLINIFSVFTFCNLTIRDTVKFRYFGSTLRIFGLGACDEVSEFWILLIRIVRQRSIRWKE